MTENELSELLKNSRKKLHFSQQDVVDKSGTGITRQYYGMIEKTERQPSVALAKKLAPVLGVHWTIFFEIDSNKKLRKTTA
ncbi:helix-turn-helix transcriptional regulator [Bacillus gobiensis]|uniref:Transcriptional regulator n=1 Tax=Bacillus gobiensis TaxID=1441095 RepID=A0A0M5JIU3_9BACI|nr:helix-turn-helix transcriptional regulator [Bacillus gobiensis]ALC81757.1 transcriptional regulator [Bacillus gobiensis]